MNIEGMILHLENDVSRLYRWDDNPLTLEELLSFIASRGKFPVGTFLEKKE